MRHKWIKAFPSRGKEKEARPAGCIQTRGRYVYAWFKGSDILPFYVGKGIGDRAWRRHGRENGEAMWCQTVRVSSVNFRVEIVRDNLTEEGAMLLEAALISFVADCGGMLANQTDGTLRREVPPLTLDSSGPPAPC